MTYAPEILRLIHQHNGKVIVVSSGDAVVYEMSLSDVVNLPEAGGQITVTKVTELSLEVDEIVSTSSADMFGGVIYISGTTALGRPRVLKYDVATSTSTFLLDDNTSGEKGAGDIRVVGENNFSWTTSHRANGSVFRIHYVKDSVIQWTTADQLTLPSGVHIMADPETKAYPIGDSGMLLFTRKRVFGAPIATGGAVFYTPDKGLSWRRVATTVEREFGRPIVDPPFVYFTNVATNRLNVYMSPDMLCTFEQLGEFTIAVTSEFETNLSSMINGDKQIIVRHLVGVSVFNK